MILGRVVGTVVATRKHPSHEGRKVLMVQPLDLDDSAVGDQLLALDGDVRQNHLCLANNIPNVGLIVVGFELFDQFEEAWPIALNSHSFSYPFFGKSPS